MAQGPAQALWEIVAGGVLGALGTVGGVYRRTKRDIKRNGGRIDDLERQVQGDPDDPNSEGVLQIAKDTKEDVEELKDMVRDVHRDVRICNGERGGQPGDD